MIPLSLGDYSDNSILLVMAITLPLLSALLLPFFGRHANLRDAVSITISLALLVVVIQLVDVYRNGVRPQVTLWQLFPGFNLTLALRPLGVIFAATAGFLWVVTTLYAIGYMRANREQGQTRFFICFALSIASAMGVAFSDNLFSLFVFYEMLTLLTYPLVTHHGDKPAMWGGRTYMAVLMSCSLGFLLPAILIVWHLTGTLDFAPNGVLAGKLAPWQTAGLLALFVFGIAKTAIMPAHRWLPAAMVAPAPVSALLHAVAVVKAGVFSLMMVIVYVFGYESLAELTHSDWWVSGWLPALAAFTILVASLRALRLDNLKQRLAYSTISQLSYIILGAALLAPLSIVGAMLHLVAHAFGKITLFFAAGAIATASGKKYVSDLDGIGRAMPWTMTAFVIGALSIIGIPPTIGFLSKWYILLGAFQQGSYFVLSVLLLSTLLSAAYLLPIIHSAFFKRAPESVTYGEAPRSMVIAMLISAGCCLALFFTAGEVLSVAAETLTTWEPLHLP